MAAGPAPPPSSGHPSGLPPAWAGPGRAVLRLLCRSQGERGRGVCSARRGACSRDSELTRLCARAVRWRAASLRHLGQLSDPSPAAACTQNSLCFCNDNILVVLGEEVSISFLRLVTPLWGSDVRSAREKPLSSALRLLVFAYKVFLPSALLLWKAP